MAFESWAKAKTRKINLSLYLANENTAQVGYVFYFI